MLFKHFFTAFSSRNYRLYTMGLLVSNIGFMIESIALAWLVYRLTHSAMYVGVLLFIMQFTIFISSSFSGILSDKYARHKVLTVTNLVLALLSVLLGVLIMGGNHSLWPIFTIQVVVGLVRGIDNPVRNTFVNDIIEKPEQLVNAISINSSLLNIARIIGPALAALIIPLAGEGLCFVINGLSFLAIIVVLHKMEHKPFIRQTGQVKVFKEIKEGIQYATGYLPICSVIVFVGLTGLLTFSLNVVVPVYCDQVLEGSADTYGFVSTHAGIGALIAALFLATKKNALGFDFIIFIASIIYSAGFLVLSFISSFFLASVIMVVIGFGQVLMFAAASSILQTLAEKDKLGRVIGFYFMFFMACTTVGSLMVGKMADELGTVATIQIITLVALVLSVFYVARLKKVRKKSLRRFIMLGIDPVSLRSFPFRRVATETYEIQMKTG